MIVVVRYLCIRVRDDIHESYLSILFSNINNIFNDHIYLHKNGAGLFNAAEYGHFDVVKLLIGRGANLNARHNVSR